MERCLASSFARPSEDKCEADPVGAVERLLSAAASGGRGDALRPHRPRKRGSAPRVLRLTPRTPRLSFFHA